uniref:Nucleolar protein 16 n=1 Tax=Pseudo-nitzschia australis TaxID=44445 RepID=A0A7S4AM78_9STRA|mmetsp:Transcript_122/g.318  ORF Transcript_122/g.318 Transcript_122/m.318 type:complete len:179 (-) Transcript_122:345-881(-)|eukprot:CAMPEP_0168191568 /NCGR_PEP_ID=MMETSP0139_2-20121125/17587_1 /TAXON_ID=44445 /ORGANISM="Pseudo-nitzschia australis, Strain 10249 10 AB" /LENGTH=178 /DNA_ID=CAMNT_0008114755 /DNA_START=129 /DNA_END=665 /DNA_ORIENTATION=-
MVKHGRNKKRRAGRIGKTKIKNEGNFKRWDPDLHKKIKNPVVREHWDPSKSFTSNLAAIGLVGNPNSDIRNTNPLQTPKAVTDVSTIELFDIPDSDQLGEEKEKRYPINEEDQKYIAKCMSKYGDDYSKAFRDIKINYMQHTENQLRKLGARFLLLASDERVVNVPEKVKCLLSADDA